jgi:uncharacterized protein
MNKIKKAALIIIGSLSLLSGVIGIFLPLLPTTPLLLLSAGCYFKSSDKLYLALINNKYLGTYIKNYQENNAISKKTKLIALSFLWISIVSSVVFLITKLFLRIMLVVIASAVTFHILKLNTLEDNENK